MSNLAKFVIPGGKNVNVTLSNHGYERKVERNISLNNVIYALFAMLPEILDKKDGNKKFLAEISFEKIYDLYFKSENKEYTKFSQEVDGQKLYMEKNRKEKNLKALKSHSKTTKMGLVFACEENEKSGDLLINVVTVVAAQETRMNKSNKIYIDWAH